ncbi:cation:proton antiporter [Halosquirtibacter xylanolyticus]|uniref:cation:proton antiporter domain-containing protein n=1 Tax=Halosquirtibacter xylanolyticus TaxID=3374599 RepID=UPI003749CFDF|nr:cation:proton antiporter [Prolixibacteraceae bacterium]
MNTFAMLIILCLVIILSALFGALNKKTNFPTVLSLLVLGVVMQHVFNRYDLHFEKQQLLEFLGNVGIIFIVLEAALDLKISSKKRTLISKSFWLALISLIGCMLVLSTLFKVFLQNLGWVQCLLYALPLSLVSSAIVIPSVHHMSEEKKDFLIYESTFSDILGIMAFYFLVNNLDETSVLKVTVNILSSTVLTVVVSIVSSLVLFYVFHKMVHRHIRFSVFIAVLVLLYALGKLFHLSSLLLILIYGVLLSNHKTLLNKFHLPSDWVDPHLSDELLSHFKLITDEGSFIIRTLFFVIFGMYLSFDDIFSLQNMLISGLFIAGIYIIHYILLKIFFKKNITPEVYIAPRGLISILLFFAIPKNYLIAEIESSLLFIVIVVTSVVMGFGLMIQSKNKPKLES